MSYMSAHVQEAQLPDPGGTLGGLPPSAGAPLMAARSICIVNPASDLDGGRFNFDDQRVEIASPSGETFAYGFDAVLPPRTSQDKVFLEIAREPVLQAVESFRSAAFIAIGCTGCGKTFAVTGGAKRFADRGLIPRSISALFEALGTRPDREEFEVAVSFYELYKDAVVDLLSERRRRVTLQKGANGPVLLGLLRQAALTESDAYHLLFQGDSNRHFERFPLNAETSRGHVFYVLHLTHTPSGQEITLSFIDLAAVVATRNHATTSIERSMQAFNTCIATMQAGLEEPPWDASGLTQLLQPLLQPRPTVPRPHIAIISPIRFNEEQEEDMYKYLEVTRQLREVLFRLDKAVVNLPPSAEAIVFDSTSTVDPLATLQWDMAPVDPSQFPPVASTGNSISVGYTAPSRSTPPSSPGRAVRGGMEDKMGAHITDQPPIGVEQYLQSTETIQSLTIEFDQELASLQQATQPQAFATYSPQPMDGDDYGPNMVGARASEPILTSVPQMTSLPPTALPPTATAEVISPSWGTEPTGLLSVEPALAPEVTPVMGQLTSTLPPSAFVEPGDVEAVSQPSWVTEPQVMQQVAPVEAEVETAGLRDMSLMSIPKQMTAIEQSMHEKVMVKTVDTNVAAAPVMSLLQSALPPAAAPEVLLRPTWSTETGVETAIARAETTSGSELVMPASLISSQSDNGLGPVIVSARGQPGQNSSPLSATLLPRAPTHPTSLATAAPTSLASAFRASPINAYGSELVGNVTVAGQDRPYASDGAYVRNIGDLPSLSLDGLDYGASPCVSGVPSHAGSHTLPVYKPAAKTTSTISTTTGASTTRSSPFMRAPVAQRPSSAHQSVVASSAPLADTIGRSNPPTSEPRGRLLSSALRLTSPERLPSQGPPMRAVMSGPPRASSRSPSPMAMPPRSPASRQSSPAVTRSVTTAYRTDSPLSNRVQRYTTTGGETSARTNVYAVSSLQSPSALPSGGAAVATLQNLRSRSRSPQPQTTAPARALSPQVQTTSYRYTPTVTPAWTYDQSAQRRVASPQPVGGTNTALPRTSSHDLRMSLLSNSSAISYEQVAPRKLEGLGSSEQYRAQIATLETSSARLTEGGYGTLSQASSFMLPATPSTSAPIPVNDSSQLSGIPLVWSTAQTQGNAYSSLPLSQGATSRAYSPLPQEGIRQTYSTLSVSQEAEGRPYSPHPASQQATGRTYSPLPRPAAAGSTPVVPWMWNGLEPLVPPGTSTYDI